MYLRYSDFPEISPKTIARIERGEVQRPHQVTLQRISEVLGVSELASY